MHEKFTARLEESLKKMQAAALAGRLKDEAAADKRLGRRKPEKVAFRCVTEPDAAQPVSLHRLGLSLPRDSATLTTWTKCSETKT